MPQPKKRHSNVRQGKRRFSNYKLAAAKTSTCPSCGAAILSHHACLVCGAYKGKPAIKIRIKQKKDKKAPKEK